MIIGLQNPGTPITDYYHHTTTASIKKNLLPKIYLTKIFFKKKPNP